jgi:hypothetical protein
MQDSRQAQIALRRSTLPDEPGETAVSLWGDESAKTAVASARAALTNELALRVKRLDDFTAAASEGVVVADALRQHFSRDVAPIIYDSAKWRESAAMDAPPRRSDPFQDILFGFEREVRRAPVTVDTRAVPVVGADTGLPEAPIASVRGGAYVNMPVPGAAAAGGPVGPETGMHKPALGVRYVSGSIRRLGLENHLRLHRGDAPVAEDAQQQMRQYLANRNAARADYSTKRGATK